MTRSSSKVPFLRVRQFNPNNDVIARELQSRAREHITNEPAYKKGDVVRLKEGAYLSVYASLVVILNQEDDDEWYCGYYTMNEHSELIYDTDTMDQHYFTGIARIAEAEQI